MKILISALESSSNMHLEALLKELDGSIEITGIFDKRLGTPLYDITELAIMGIVDALKKLPFFLRVADAMVEAADSADKVLLMDSSGFNLPLAKKLKKRYPEKEIIYYILPQAWAWKRGRIKALMHLVDRLASILPFEPSYYPNGAPITYVGHPLLDEIEEFKNGPEDNSDTIAFMPGSRRTEIVKLLPIFEEVRKELKKRAVVIIPRHFSDSVVDEYYGDYLQNFEISKDTHSTLRNAKFAFICSGTATLEAALIGTPFVLAYIAKPIDFFIGRRLVKLKHVGLANIILEKMGVAPLHIELLQNEVSAKALLDAYERVIPQSFYKEAQELKKILSHGSSKNVAELVMQ